MNRTIKFRAWDKDNNKMLNNIHEIWRLDSKGFNEPSEHNNLRLSWTNENGIGYWRDIIPSQVHLMQFTGLKDKNGVDIYEGDILKAIDVLLTVWYNESTASFDVLFYGDETGDTESLYSQIEASIPLEIIGNIHQNPELLTK